MIPVTPFYMAIEAIITGVENAPFKPPVVRTVGVRKNFGPSVFPRQLLCSMPPECLRIYN